MTSRHFTFHTLLAGCERGEFESWQAFLSAYTPIVFRLLEVYAPEMNSAARRDFWETSVSALAAEDFKKLREFDRQAEREFLGDLKAFLIDRILSLQEKEAGPSVIAAENVSQHLAGRPIAHQEILWLSWSGYSSPDLEKLLVVPGTLVAKALEVPEGRPIFSPAASGLTEWLKFLRDVRAARTEHCCPPRVFVRIMDGQISWYDKTPAEKHLAGCLTCIDAWATLREVDSCRREIAPLTGAEVADLLASLPLTRGPARGSWLGRLLNR